MYLVVYALYNTLREIIRRCMKRLCLSLKKTQVLFLILVAIVSDLCKHVDKHAISVAAFIQHNRNEKCEYVFSHIPRHSGLGPASATGALR